MCIALHCWKKCKKQTYGSRASGNLKYIYIYIYVLPKDYKELYIFWSRISPGRKVVSIKHYFCVSALQSSTGFFILCFIKNFGPQSHPFWQCISNIFLFFNISIPFNYIWNWYCTRWSDASSYGVLSLQFRGQYVFGNIFLKCVRIPSIQLDLNAYICLFSSAVSISLLKCDWICNLGYFICFTYLWVDCTSFKLLNAALIAFFLNVSLSFCMSGSKFNSVCPARKGQFRILANLV